MVFYVVCCGELQYYYFIRLMGRQASHVSLECALQSQANMVCAVSLKVSAEHVLGC